MIRSRFALIASLTVAALASIAMSAAERIDLVRPLREAVLLFELPALVFLSASLVFTASQVLRVLRSYRISFGLISALVWPAPQTGVPQLTAFA